jgi:ATP-binding cassette, subfamily C, bacteriocin exporter
MQRSKLKQYENAFISQQEQSDCGVACLAALARYFGGDVKIDYLRTISGTSKQGTTLLGMQEAAIEIGLEAEAFEADMPSLKAADAVCILHVIIDKRLHHYVICYGYNDQEKVFILSDPAKGILLLEENELNEIWQSKALLIIREGKGFIKSEEIKSQKMYWLKKLLEEDANILTVSACLGLIIAVLGLSTAVFSQKLIDDILPNSKQLKLEVGLTLLFFLLIVRSFLTYIRQNFLLKQSRDFNNRIIAHFYNSLLKLPKSFFDNRKTGELVARMNDTNRIQNTLSYITSNLVIDLLLVVISAVFLLTYSVKLGIIGLLSLPVYFIITYVYHKHIVDAQREVMHNYARNESNYVDTIQGVNVIKNYNKEEVFSEKTKKIYDLFQQKVFGLGKVKTDFNLWSDIMGTILFGTIIVWGSVMVLNGDFKLGVFMAVMQITGILMPAAGRLALTNIQIQEAKVAFERMFEFTSVKPEYKAEEEKEKISIKEFHSLEINNVSFRFPGRQLLLKQISFQLQRNKIIAILGESGSGKSTLLQILQRFYHKASGSIKVNEVAWEDLSTVNWRNLIAIVPQEVKIFSGTLIDNICFESLPDKTERVITFCKQLGFHDYFMKFPQSYFTLLGEEGINISGGQQQLVALARALFKDPQILLMDEPTSAMDRKTEAFIINLLDSLKSKMSMILVTHKIKTAKKADCIYILENGIIKESGNHEELMRHDNFYSLSLKD